MFIIIKSYLNREKISYVIPYLILCAIHIILGLQISIPVIWPDEHLYLLMSQMITGLKEFNGIEFYGLEGSFGYPLLISPLYFFTQEPVAFFKSVMVLNSLLGSTIFIAVYLIAKEAFNAPKKDALITAVIVSLYPAYLLQSTVAYTDAITPALFSWVFYSFYKLLEKKSVASALVFVLLTVFISSVHSRFLPLILISIFIVIFLFIKKELNGTIASIVIAFLMFTIFIIFAVSNILVDNSAGTNNFINRIVTIIFSLLEVLFLISILFGILGYLSKRQYPLLALVLITGLSGSVQSYIPYVILIPIIYCLLLLILHKKFKLKLSETIFAILLSAVIYSLFLLIAYIYPNSSGFIYYLELWLINSIGTFYYGQFSTNAILGASLIFLLVNLYRYNLNAGKGLDNNSTEFKSDNNGLIIRNFNLYNYLFWSFIFLFIITKSASSYSSDYYRSDHLFYGRYMEAFMAPVFALGVLNVIRLKWKSFLLYFCSSIALFVLISFILINHYGITLKSDLSVHSVLSIFPLRAAMGELNLAVFLVFAVATSFIWLIIKKNKIIGSVLLSVYFLFTSIFTYYYVSIYYQYEKSVSTVVADKISELNPYKTIYYQNNIKYKFSGNDYTNVFLLPDYSFNFVRELAEREDKIFIDNGISGFSNQNSFLLAVESTGEDHLWINTDTVDKSIMNHIPEFTNLNLIDSAVAGVKRIKFINNSWINGKSSLIFNNPDTFSKIDLSFSVFNSYDKESELIVYLNSEEIFNEMVKPGAWKYELDISIAQPSHTTIFDFYSDLETNKENYLLGISLLNVQIEKTERSVLKPITCDGRFNGFFQPVRVWFRENIIPSLLHFQAGKEITLPIKIKNFTNSSLSSSAESNYSFTYCWKDYITRKTVFESEPVKISSIPENHSYEFLNTLKAPEKSGKYFLEMLIYKNNAVIDKRIYEPKKIVINVKK